MIKFGTSGWRAIIADDFTFANVERAVDAIARTLLESSGADRAVAVGYDTRFLSERFAAGAARRLQDWGLRVELSPEAIPTPALAYAIVRDKLAGGINFTASHNPPEYNGLKFSTADGAPALPEVTSRIESLLDSASRPAQARGGSVPLHDLQSDAAGGFRRNYLDRLREIVRVDAIRDAGLAVVFDPLWGTARGYTDALLREAGITVEVLHDFRDVLFGGHAPEPEHDNTRGLAARMRAAGITLGIATDGDADRFGVLDETGEVVSPNYIIALLFDYLVESRGWRNGVGKSVATTNLVNALADYHRVPLYETPVGFKYLGELIAQDKIAIGGEESAGLSIRHHVPEKDGILAGLLVAEMVATRRVGIQEQLRALFAKVGSFYPIRENFRLTPGLQPALTKKLAEEPAQFAGHRVVEFVRKDGLKMLLDDGSWVLFRPSGTEPVVRLYAETRERGELKPLVERAQQYLLGKS
jgi:phosphoglucomutase